MEQTVFPRCERCGTINATDAQFCYNCGHALSNNFQIQAQSSYSDLLPSLSLVPFQYGRQATPKLPKKTRREFIVGGLAAAALAGAGVYLLTAQALFPPTITLNFTYSTEKATWIQEAVSNFNKGNAQIDGKTVRVVATGLGSVETLQGLLNKNLLPMPHAWSPASDLELQQLSNAWQKKYGSQNIISDQYSAEPLVQSPLVFAVWKDRAEVLLDHYPSIDWPSIHDALRPPGDWARIGGPPQWQTVKFGQTRPDTSNSGLLTLTLMAYSFYGKSRNLTTDDIRNNDFQAYLYDIESAVQKFGSSTGTYLQDEVILNGPSSYDLITTYENLVITQQQLAQTRDGEALQPYYPSLNIVSNHPFAILQGDWINPEEQFAASMFRDFLLSDAQQQKALLNGFRPVRINNPVEDKMPGNPFQSHAVQPFLKDIPQRDPLQVQTPGGDVIDEIINLWKQRYGNSVTTD